jgi:uncharacterized membrane protein (DUF106 family)
MGLYQGDVSMNLERKVEVYEAVLRKVVTDHEKMRELMVHIMLWQHSLRDGEKTQEEQEVERNEAFERLARLVGV